MGRYVAVFLASAGTVLAVTPLVRLLARKLGAIDEPSDRKVHPKPTPTLGGIGLLLGVLAGIGVAYAQPEFRPIFQASEIQGVVLAGVVLTAVGLIDDLRAISAPAKVAGQVLAAGLLVLNGVELLFFWFPTQGIISLGADLSVPLTVLWVLLLVNAVNLIDGLDGLAAGIVAIAAGAFFAYAFVGPTNFGEPIPSAALLCSVAAGVAVGFLPYNFYPARIFMGDSGSMLLGVLLAAATISGVGRPVRPSGGDIAAFAIPVLIPVLVLAVPLVDVGLAILRRLRRGRGIFIADKEHIHHQLRELGHTHRQAVLLMYFWSVLLSGSALAITFVNGRALVGSIVGGSLVLIAATFVPRRIHEVRRARRVAKGAEPAVEAPVGTKPV